MPCRTPDDLFVAGMVNPHPCRVLMVHGDHLPVLEMTPQLGLRCSIQKNVAACTSWLAKLGKGLRGMLHTILGIHPHAARGGLSQQHSHTLTKRCQACIAKGSHCLTPADHDEGKDKSRMITFKRTGTPARSPPTSLLHDNMQQLLR